MLTWAICLSTFLGCLLVFIALLGNLAEVDMLMLFMLFMLVQVELHTVNFLLSTHYLSANSITLVHRHMITAFSSCRISRGRHAHVIYVSAG
jgi:hypothetical protein